MLSKNYKERLRKKIQEKINLNLDDNQLNELIQAVHKEDVEMDYEDYENFLVRNLNAETTLPDRYAVIASKKSIKPREESYSIERYNANFDSIFVSGILEGELGYIKSNEEIEDKPLALSCEEDLTNETYYNMINKVY